MVTNREIVKFFENYLFISVIVFVAIVGTIVFANSLIGRTEEYGMPTCDISTSSIGQRVQFDGRNMTVVGVEDYSWGKVIIELWDNNN